MRTNRLKELWRQNGTATNAWVTIPSSWTAEILAHAGFDALTIDAQHGLASDLSAILPMLQAIGTTDTVPLVRVPWNDPATHMRMLDAGAQGIICPMINTREEAEQFVGACRYPPVGYRSYGPLRAELHLGSDYFQRSNEEILTLAMIESASGFKNIEDIAQTPSLDGFYIGPWDLSLALGIQRIADFEDTQLLNAIDKVLSVATKYGLMAGIHCGTPEVAARMKEKGFHFVTSTVDTPLLKKAAADVVKRYGYLIGK
ncbi:HpcH/HpaI aldolase/citrate lyase family protein [Telluribacter sp. SYSU D00476]|uniref:HpcH/HpaI aldolase family protein n=1 Tax=Telluribacter sp. SYSU D00476 TaxID=2811430 RepID=UPI001FF0E542|nr:aldolase/citrate lyase family protein [Telluribacter sp. SYSU D00476]